MTGSGRNNILFSFGHLTDIRARGARVIVRGEDCHVWDEKGKRYIDGFSGLQVVNIGHGRKEVTEAVCRQMEKLQYWHSFFGFTTAPAIELAEKLAAITPGSLNTVHFVNSGSEGADSAFKLSRAFFALQGLRKYKILYRNKAYHGTNMGATSANGYAGNRSFYEPLVPGFIRVPQCHCYRCPFSLQYPACKIACALALEKTILDEGPETVAAFIADPIQGSVGGYVPAVKEYFPLVRQICDRYNVLFICDEVITGFGRTGKMFGIEHEKVVPDIMITAKGLSSGYIPIGAVMVSEKIAGVLADAVFAHGYTYGGHPVAAACALANLAIIEKENLAQNAAEIGNYLAKQLQKLPCLGELRSRGMLFGLELVRDVRTREPFPVGFAASIIEKAYENGLIMRMSTGGAALLLCPPLTMKKTLACELAGILQQSMEEVCRNWT